ncbi:glutathione S-transferase family protein [Caulobacter sp. S45]|uniref:glutathione S-transferase family protein n=1 Tax=Caulobacter sp. S45 TaxID=1641861 RepID=UPI00131DC4BE|nr:glutathione S-transferase family protein [Caulobacter sp. S45]
MITLHHLNFSRSSRVLWLLEELGLKYNLVKYERNERFRAPPELAKVHPLGKAPVIQDGDLILAESAVILNYINAKYGEGRLAPAPGTREHDLHEEWLQYVESSAAFPIMLKLIGGMTGGLTEGLDRFTGPSISKTLDYVAAGVGQGPYLLGEIFSLADIQFSYLLEMAAHGGLLAKYPALTTYLEQLKSRPAFVRAVEIGGPMTPPKA